MNQRANLKNILKHFDIKDPNKIARAAIESDVKHKYWSPKSEPWSDWHQERTIQNLTGFSASVSKSLEAETEKAIATGNAETVLAMFEEPLNYEKSNEALRQEIAVYKYDFEQAVKDKNKKLALALATNVKCQLFFYSITVDIKLFVECMIKSNVRFIPNPATGVTIINQVFYNSVQNELIKRSTAKGESSTAIYQKALLASMAECFGIENQEAVLKIAHLCIDEESKDELATLEADVAETLKRDLAVIKKHGYDYYVNEHAKAYINVKFYLTGPANAYEKAEEAKKEFFRRLHLFVNFGNEQHVERELKKLFLTIKFTGLYVDKRQFVAYALKGGYEVKAYTNGLTPFYIENIKKELLTTDAPQATATPPATAQPIAKVGTSESTEQGRKIALALAENDLNKAEEMSETWQMLKVGLLALTPKSINLISGEMGFLNTDRARRLKDAFTLHMKETYCQDVTPYYNKPKRPPKK